MAAAAPASPGQRYVEKAEALKPRLTVTPCAPTALVRPVEDRSKFLLYRMEPAGELAGLAGRKLKHGDSFIVDFGRHITGRVAFSLSGTGEAVDSPVRLKLTFGETPVDVAVPMESYTGTLSRAWLPDEVINVDFLPRRVELPRRYAFRYVKFEVIDTSPNFSAHIDRIEATALTSARGEPGPLPGTAPEWLRRIDRVSLATLRDCMQTVFEDGPRRGRRLWVGDLRLSALTNYATYKNNDLVKRCLYLFAGLRREDGLVAACVFDQPEPLCGRQYIMDYAVLYAACMRDYLRATGDKTTARDLWPVVKRQFEIVGAFVNGDGLFVDPGGWWIFIDWRDGLDTTAAMHAVLLYGYQRAWELARELGVEREVGEYPARIAKMKDAARRHFYDAGSKVFLSGPKKQASWASQAWMILAQAVTAEEGAAALRAVAQRKDAVPAATPYLHHYLVDAMLECGMKDEALDLLRRYWGGMVEHGADTFWEVYDPSNPARSPYGSLLVNSYCHAWSCTPSYFLRARGLG